jgi:hypothetical protein
VKYILIFIFDLLLKENIKDFPNGVRYGLLFENIDCWWDKSRIFKFLSKIPLEG